jgi:hypothetical protein
MYCIENRLTMADFIKLMNLLEYLKDQEDRWSPECIAWGIPRYDA